LLILCLVARVAAAEDKPNSDAKSSEFLAAFDDDPKAKEIAKTLFDNLGHVTMAGADEVKDGGFRGKIHLVPELPKSKYRQQLVWVAEALIAIDTFFGDLKITPKYRWRELTLHFVRSENKRTPSAYAIGWSITHNVVGSLLTSERGVRETYFHELFHLNDCGEDVQTRFGWADLKVAARAGSRSSSGTTLERKAAYVRLAPERTSPLRTGSPSVAATKLRPTRARSGVGHGRVRTSPARRGARV
jgi:hypothetical protein